MIEWLDCLSNFTRVILFVILFFVIATGVNISWDNMRNDGRWYPKTWYEAIFIPISYLFLSAIGGLLVYGVVYFFYDIVKCIICPEC